MVQKTVSGGRNRTMTLAVELGSRIAAGHWPAGGALPTEGEIQHSFGVSRTVVREAVRHLAAKGLVAVGPKVGTRVRAPIEWNMLDSDVLHWLLLAGPSRAFIDALYELRLINEPEAARLAANRIAPAALAGLAESLAAMGRFPRGSQALVDADLGFHRQLLEATGNPLLCSLGTVIERSLAISFSLSWRRNPQEETVSQHARVLDAIRRGDGEAAALFMRQLIESAYTDVIAELFPPSAGSPPLTDVSGGATGLVPFATPHLRCHEPT